MFSIIGDRVLSQALASTEIENGDGEERDGHHSENNVRQAFLLSEARRRSKLPLAADRPLAAEWILLTVEHGESPMARKG
jgi:hypothetical protein